MLLVMNTDLGEADPHTKGTLSNYFLKINVIMMLREGGG